MKKRRFSEEQIIAILQEGEGAESKREVCRRRGISEHTFYRWRTQYAGLSVSQLHQLKVLTSENARLKKLVAEQMLANEALREVLVKRGLL